MKKLLLIMFALMVTTFAVGQKFQVLPASVSEDGTPVVMSLDNSAGNGAVNPNPENDYLSAWVVPGLGASSGNTRCPGNTWKYQRTEYLITAAEMATSGFPVNADINAIGWLISTAGGTTQTGTLRVWLKNTSDATYAYGTTWTLTDFTKVHEASFTVPIAVGSYEVQFSGGSTFTYTGGGVYVAWEFENPGTAGATALVANCNNSLSNSLAGGRSNTDFSFALTLSAFRPATLFGNNYFTDVLAMESIWALEKTPIPYGAPTDVTIRVKNTIATPATFDVTLTIKDATNTITRYTATQTVTNLAGGATAEVAFPWTPTITEDIKITGTATAAPGETFLVNNTMTLDGNVNSNLFGYFFNMTNPPGAVGWVSPTYTAIFANRFEMKNAGILTGANLAIGNSATNTGQTIYAVALNKNGQIIAQSAPYVIQAGDLGLVVNFPFTTTPNVAPEEFYVGLANTPSINASSYYPMGYWTETPTRPNTFYRFDIGGSPPQSIDGYKFGIEAQVAPFTGVVYPRNLTGNPVGTTQIDLSWVLNPNGNNVMVAVTTDNVWGTPVNGTAYSAGTTLPGGGLVIYNGGLTAYSHTGLTPGTTYYYRAFSVDGSTTYSSPASTSAATWYVPPYVQAFEVTTSLPVGWTGNMYVEALHGTSSSSGITFDLYDDADYHFCNATSPHIVLPANTCKATFDYRLTNWDQNIYPHTAKVMGPGDKVELQLSTDHGATWNTIYTINSANHVQSVDFANVSVTLTGYTGQVMLQIKGTWGEGDYWLDVDNFTVEELPLCPPPTSLTATSVTINSASIGWTGPVVMEGDYGPIGHTAGTGTPFGPTTTNPHQLAGLAPGTGYAVYLRQQCSPGVYSPWAGPLTFTTPKILQVTPDPHDFGNVTTGTSTAPQVFTIKNNGAGAILIDGVWISGTDASQFVLTDGTTYPYNLAAGAQYTVSVVFTPAGTGLKTANLVVSENETEHLTPLSGTGVCPTPSALTVANVTTTTADIGWTANGSTAWEIEYGLYGFVQGTGTMITTGVTNPYTLTGLLHASVYTYYVRAVCGASTYSAWAGPMSFYTLCNPLTLPYTQNFDALPAPNLPVCWSRYSSAAQRPWQTSSGVGAVSTPNAVAVFYNSAAPKDEWLVSPALYLTPGLMHEVKFWVLAPGWGGVPEKLKLVMSADPSLAALQTAPILWDNPNLTVSTYTEFVVNFMPTSSGPYYFAWHAYSAADVDYIAMDNITIQVSAVPENLSVTGTVGQGQNNCYNASNTITVSDLTVQSGGSATFKAGQKISFLPGIMVELNGYLLGQITTSYCSPADGPLAAATEQPAKIEHLNFSLFPNPTNGDITIVQKGNGQASNVRVEIYGMHGERVLMSEMIGAKQVFNTSSLPSGLYFVKVVADGYTETIKLVKTR